MTAPCVSLTIPRDRRYVGVVGLVVGGLAARFELGLDRVDDLRLALEAAAFDGPSDRALEIEISVDGVLELQAGPLASTVRERLSAESGPLSLSRVLGSLVDESEVLERDDGDWLLLRQRPTGGA